MTARSWTASSSVVTSVSIFKVAAWSFHWAPVAEPADAAAPPVPGIETPEPTAGRLLRLRTRLARSQTTLGRGLLSVLSRDRLDDDAWDEVEEALLTADVGVAATTEIVDRLRTR